MNAHTAAPWRKEGRAILGRAFDGSEKNICDQVRGGSPASAEANANLIVAAPDLLVITESVATAYEQDAAADPSFMDLDDAQPWRGSITHGIGRLAVRKAREAKS